MLILAWKLFSAPNIPRAIPFTERGGGGISRGDTDYSWAGGPCKLSKRFLEG